MIFLRNLKLEMLNPEKESFPWNLLIWQNTKEISFGNPVTLFVGENGSGKSTVLESLALAIDMVTVGSENINKDQSLNRLKEFSRSMKLTWNKKTKRGFFLRAEDFFGYVKRVNQTREEMISELGRVEREYKDRSTFARMQARSPFAGAISDMDHRYGKEGLDGRSHGESFLALFQNRFVPEGLYLLDEPEVPLSPLRQLTFIALVKQMVEEGSQFIIATHSPILLAYPGATILQFSEEGIKEAAFDELEHVNLMRDFLNNPASFLRHL
jgi:predicted ATPase